MRIIFTALFLYLFSGINAQSLEVFAGMGWNEFFDKGYDNGRYSSTYKMGLASCIGVGIYKKANPIYSIGASLKWVKMKGTLEVEGGGMGAGFHLKSEVDLAAIELGLTPLKLSLLDNRLCLQLGLEIAFTKKAKLPGDYMSWYLDYDYTTYPPKSIYRTENIPMDNSEKYVENMALIAFIRMGYAINIGHQMSLIPRIYAGHGLSNRFTEKVESTPKNRLSLLEVSLLKDLR